MLDQAWADVPPELRGAAGLTLRAHLEKLGAGGSPARGSGSVPAGVRSDQAATPPARSPSRMCSTTSASTASARSLSIWQVPAAAWPPPP